MRPLILRTEFSLLKPLGGRGCELGQQEIIARPDRESIALAIIKDSDELTYSPMSVRIRTLNASVADTWYAKSVGQLRAPSVVIQAFQRGATDFGAHVPIIIPGAHPSDLTKVVSICVSDNSWTTLADAKYYVAHSTRPIQASLAD